MPRNCGDRDLAWMHVLNEQHAVELSSLTPERLTALVERARYAKVVDFEAAFLLAFDQDAEYDSPNFLWFGQRLPQFLYVDRIVVSDQHRGKGLARELYEDLFAAAHALGHTTIVCEVNMDPPNPASDPFHESLGFGEIGCAKLDNGKSVRYLRRELT